MRWAGGSSIQRRKPRIARCFEDVVSRSWTSSQVKEEIGYDSAPAASVIETRKSVVAGNSAPAAAALTPSRVGAMNCPAAFLISAAGSPFEMA